MRSLLLPPVTSTNRSETKSLVFFFLIISKSLFFLLFFVFFFYFFYWNQDPSLACLQLLCKIHILVSFPHSDGSPVYIPSCFLSGFCFCIGQGLHKPNRFPPNMTSYRIIIPSLFLSSVVLCWRCSSAVAHILYN